MKQALVIVIAAALAGCIDPPRRPPKPPDVGYADFDARGRCVSVKLQERVKSADSDLSLQSSASAVVGMCSYDMWRRMEAQEPWNSPYRFQRSDRDRSEATMSAYAEARDIREDKRKLDLK